MSLAQRTKKHSIILKLGLATCKPLPSHTYVHTTGASGKLPRGPLQPLSPTTLLSFRTTIRAFSPAGGWQGHGQGSSQLDSSWKSPTCSVHSQWLPGGDGRGAGKLWLGQLMQGDSARGLLWSGVRGALLGLSEPLTVWASVCLGHLKTVFPHLLSSASPAPCYCGISVRTHLSHVLPSSHLRLHFPNTLSPMPESPPRRLAGV